MVFAAVVINLIFWGLIILAIYNSYISPKVDSYKDKQKAINISKEFGGVSNIYSDDVELLETLGFNILRDEGEYCTLNKTDEDVVANFQIRPISTEEAKYIFNMSTVGGKEPSYEEVVKRGSKQHSGVYNVLENFILENVDRERMGEEINEIGKLFERIIGRKEVFRIHWNEILRESGDNEWMQFLVGNVMVKNAIYPPIFFENFRYLLFKNEGKDHLNEIKNCTSWNMHDLEYELDQYEHVRIPYWFLSCFPKESAQLINENPKFYTGIENSVGVEGIDIYSESGLDKRLLPFKEHEAKTMDFEHMYNKSEYKSIRKECSAVYSSCDPFMLGSAEHELSKLMLL